MSIVVQKFGGTSVADCEKIRAAARKAVRAHQAGHRVVVVVSAMGKHTDILIQLAEEICDDAPAREMDMLLSTGEQISVSLMAMAIHDLGYDAVSLTGAQIGIRTDSAHTKARIREISTARVQELLHSGEIVIAAGFQGIDEEFNITTLGRGGSDTTAVALAAVLDCEACEIYTDVDGVFTTDPRILPEARQLRRVSYDEMLELASLGAGVMHSRSIEFAKKFNVPIHVRSSFSDVPGTIIGPLPESPDRPVSGAALTKKEARITVEGIPDQPGTSLELFSPLAARNIPVDMIVQNVGAGGRANISFTVLQGDLNEALAAIHEAAEGLGARQVTHDDRVSKVSVVGLGMERQSGVAEAMFRALADAGVNIEMISTSEIKISVLVARGDAQKALRAVHETFELHKAPPEPSELQQPEATLKHPATDPALVAQRLTGMEELVIEGVTLDEAQSRVSLNFVPDQPGVAARIFESVAAAGVNVDMIVQSGGHDNRANLSFTVPHHDLEKTIEAIDRLVEQIEGTSVAHSPSVAKLTVSGIGMRSHTGVAVSMFRALSQAEINVEMINTSEVRVNVVVAAGSGTKALECLRREFEDSML